MSGITHGTPMSSHASPSPYRRARRANAACSAAEATGSDPGTGTSSIIDAPPGDEPQGRVEQRVQTSAGATLPRMVSPADGPRPHRPRRTQGERRASSRVIILAAALDELFANG
ncbi:hypothetical protein [Pseudonocardia alni]|uniref:hypothetical protein n=1 Tax=Pseudonocardia alni TaxID=33907 RepID=UPI00279A4EA3|nr:hypothetical protein PaSha_09690 [Pseudonocardia alni]